MLFALCAIGVSQRSQQRTQGSLFTIQALTPIFAKPDGIPPKKLLDASKLNSLGWKPEISLTEGIRATYNEYLIK